MFAGAAREVVFSNPKVVDRINRDFIPVALKAGLVNNPPAGKEGQLYAEIARSRPAAQGISTINSDGKVLAWSLSFDDEDSILGFLDHVAERYKKQPDKAKPVVAERFQRFPSHKLDDVPDTGRLLDLPTQHAATERCPAEPNAERGMLVGKVIGRALDEQGQPVSDTQRQEQYMESTLRVSAEAQRELLEAASQREGQSFVLPDSFVEQLVGAAHLGQLDVNPLGKVPGSRNELRDWTFSGHVVSENDKGDMQIRIQGESDVAAGQDQRAQQLDGRLWENRITLRWLGYVEIQSQSIAGLSVIAEGLERLRWGNAQFDRMAEPSRHLMAGHRIDFQGGVRYGLSADAR